MVASESTLERDLYNLLEFDPMVESYEEQPVTLPYQHLNGQPSRYTPDVIIHLRKSPKFIWQYSPFRAFFGQSSSIDSYLEGFLLKPKIKFVTPKAILGEVKYREELFSFWRELKPKFKAARRYAEKIDWQFLIFTEKEIRTPLLKNIKFIRSYGRYEFSAEEILRVIDKLAELGECRTFELLAALTDNRTEQGHLIPVIWHLVFRHEIEVDWNQPITMRSSLSSLV